MDFSVGPALPAGPVGNVAMTAAMTVGRAMGMTLMDIALISGATMAGDGRRARMLGMVVHVVGMGTVVSGLIYAAPTQTGCRTLSLE